MPEGRRSNSNAAVGADDEKSSAAAGTRDIDVAQQDDENRTGRKPMLTKISSNQPSLNIPSRSRRARSQSPDTLSLISADDFSELRQVLSSSSASSDVVPQQPTLNGFRGKVAEAWSRNKGLVWVVCAQAFGVLMNASTRLLEGKENGGMHPLQILFARMSITSTLAMLYMYFTSTPDFPFGAREVRWLLVARGLGGFFGVFGLYSSLKYLPLSDATVITFLAPIVTCWLCSKLLHESFTRYEQIGAVISLLGVVLIARPTALFSTSPAHAQTGAEAATAAATNATSFFTRAIATDAKASPAQRLMGVGMALSGVGGSIVAYTTIRWIGKRAHPLVSVNYFAVWCTIVSMLCLLFLPSVPFILPSTLKQWGLLFLIGIGGFVMQFLLTAGLRYEKGSRATNMVYTQMLFAVAADKVIWNDTPDAWSLGGSGLILGSALVVAVQKSGFTKPKEVESGSRDEEAAIIQSVTEPAEEMELLEPARRSLDAQTPEIREEEDEGSLLQAKEPEQ